MPERSGLVTWLSEAVNNQGGCGGGVKGRWQRRASWRRRNALRTSAPGGEDHHGECFRVRFWLVPPRKADPRILRTPMSMLRGKARMDDQHRVRVVNPADNHGPQVIRGRLAIPHIARHNSRCIAFGRARPACFAKLPTVWTSICETGRSPNHRRRPDWLNPPDGPQTRGHPGQSRLPPGGVYLWDVAGRKLQKQVCRRRTATRWPPRIHRKLPAASQAMAAD